MCHDHSMRDAQDVPLHRMIPKSSLSTSFSTACPSASKTVGLPG